MSSPSRPTSSSPVRAPSRPTRCSPGGARTCCAAWRRPSTGLRAAASWSTRQSLPARISACSFRSFPRESVMAQLEGQVALVTGGGSGIGRAVVDRYIEEGAQVCVMDVSADRLAELSQQHAQRVTGVHGDATTVEANERAVGHTVEKFGKLDVFVANAGLGDAFR